MTFAEAFRSIIARWLAPKPRPTGPLPEPERQARRETPAANVAAYFAELDAIRDEQALQADLEAGYARCKAERLKRREAALKGIANRGRG